MSKGRLEAFTDGVLAIVITIMVLEMKVPDGIGVEALKPIIPLFLTYLGSFVYLGIYWNNHHHIMQIVHKVNGRVLWANLHLLFWLSLFPFVTGWMGENHFQTYPVMLYGIILFMAAVAYKIWVYQLIKSEGPSSDLEKSLGKDNKMNASIVLYFLGIGLSLIHPIIGLSIYVFIGVVWIVPEKRIEKYLHSRHKNDVPENNTDL